MKSNANEQFLVSLVARHGPALLRFMVTRLPHAADAPDLVQEIYLRLLRVARPELIRCPEAYLFTIASNIVREHGLKRTNRPIHVALDNVPGGDQWTGPEASVTEAAEDALIQDERMRKLERAIAQLSRKPAIPWSGIVVTVVPTMKSPSAWACRATW